MSICDYNRCLLSIIPGDRCHIIFIYQLWFLFYGSFTIALYRPTFQYKIFFAPFTSLLLTLAEDLHLCKAHILLII